MCVCVCVCVCDCVNGASCVIVHSSITGAEEGVPTDRGSRQCAAGGGDGRGSSDRE